MELSKRLQAVVDLLDSHKSIADIGCDHGFVSIYLIQAGKAENCIAMDVNKGPLKSAKENIAFYGLLHKIELRLSNGADKLQWKEDSKERILEADAAILAGIGGRLTIRILEESLEKFHAMEEFILQPQSEIEKVRQFLEVKGFIIVKEDMVLEDGKYYPIMKVSRQKEFFVDKCMSQKEQALFYRYGEKLLSMAHPVLYEYLLKEEKMYCDILNRLEGKETEKSVHRRKDVKKKLDLIKDGLRWFSHEM